MDIGGGWGGLQGWVVEPPPPCDPIQVFFSLFCVDLHARVQTCKGARDCGGDKWMWGEVGGGVVGLGCGGPPPHVTPFKFCFHCYVWACTRVCKRARAQRSGGGDKGMWGKRTPGGGGGGCRVGLWDPPHVTPLRFSFQCYVWPCTRVCKRARVQGNVGGINGCGGRLGGVVGLGCGNPPPPM